MKKDDVLTIRYNGVVAKATIVLISSNQRSIALAPDDGLIRCKTGIVNMLLLSMTDSGAYTCIVDGEQVEILDAN